MAITPEDYQKYVEVVAQLNAEVEKTAGSRDVSAGIFFTGVNQISQIVDGQTNLGAFGRLRVANPFSLFDGKTLLDANTRYWDDQEVSGSGTGSTFSSDRASVTLSVAGTTAGNRVRQTFRRFPYVPGKSQLTLITFVHGALVSGVSRKIGLFDDNNGILLDTADDVIRVAIRSSSSGSPVDTVVPQDQWNIDPLDGTGSSGVTLDLTKTHIFVVDYEWLGVGRVRIGFNIDGVTYYCHEFLNANNLDVVYMSSPNLPVRYEIENSGTGPAAVLECICSTVISEGGERPVGRPFAVTSSALRTDINGTGATRYALAGLRINAANSSFGFVQPISASVIGTTNNDAFAWELILGGTIAGSPTWVSKSGSAAECFDGDSSNTVTGGEVLASGVSVSQSNLVIEPQNLPGPGVAIDGTPQVLSLIARPYTNMSAVASLGWIER